MSKKDLKFEANHIEIPIFRPNFQVSDDLGDDDDGGSNSPVTVGNESKFVTMTENEAEEMVEKEKDAQHHTQQQQEPEETFRSSASPSSAALPDQFLLQESQVITSTTEQVTSLSGGFQMTAADVDQFLSNTTTTTHMEVYSFHRLFYTVKSIHDS